MRLERKMLLGVLRLSSRIGKLDCAAWRLDAELGV